MISSLELARLCGVSQGTVDRALHGRPGVSLKTRARIEAVAREHGYRPHPAMHEMLSGRSPIVGMIVPTVNAVFFMDFLKAVKDACAVYGWRLFITPVADSTEMLDAIGDLAARRVGGVLAAPPEEGIVIPEQIVRSLRIATLLSPCENAEIPLFAPDERRTGAEAVAYLAGLGHRRILHVTYARRAFAIQERQAGYEEAMAEQGLSAGVCIFTDPAALREALRSYRPTALFCHNDAMALAAMRVLAEDGISVPGTRGEADRSRLTSAPVSVLGVDNSPTFQQFQPDITTMPYPVQEIARKAVLWLRDGVDERPISPLQVLEKGTTLPPQ